MPRHIAVAAILNGLIPRDKLSEDILGPDRMKELNQLIADRKLKSSQAVLEK